MEGGDPPRAATGPRMLSLDIRRMASLDGHAAGGGGARALRVILKVDDDRGHLTEAARAFIRDGGGAPVGAAGKELMYSESLRRRSIDA